MDPDRFARECRIYLLKLIVILLLLLFFLFESKARAEPPPHPRLAYKWEVLPQGQVVLYFLEDGYKSRYVYPLVRNAEPAVECTPKYEKDKFTLFTWDTSHPYKYQVSMEPSHRWDVAKKQYIEVE